jgi:superfamily I DNA/RNA helicase
MKLDPSAAEDAVIAKRAAGVSPAAIWSFPAAKVILSLNADLSRFGVSRASHTLMAERIRLYRPETMEELISALRETPETKSTSGVNVITVHAAKGEEWDAVIVPGADLYENKGEMPEERRLMFVATTRARRHLTVTAANERRTILKTGQNIVQIGPVGELFSTIQAVADRHCSAQECH